MNYFMTPLSISSSDWSDDDLEEMEKMFGDIQQRLNEVQQLDSDDSQILNKGGTFSFS